MVVKMVQVKDDVHDWLSMQRVTSKRPIKDIVDELIRKEMV